MHPRRLTLSLCVLSLIGCEPPPSIQPPIHEAPAGFEGVSGGPESPEPIINGEDAAPPVSPNFPLLPAFETEEERSQAPMSQALPELYRQLNPLLYQTTPPPRGAIRRPGEFEPVADLYLTYMRYLPELDALYGDVIEASWEVAHVHVVVEEGELPTFQAILDARGIPRVAVEPITQVPTDSIWMRDYGPGAVFVGAESETLELIDLSYYTSRPMDDAAPTRIGEAQGLEATRPELKGEWGNVMTNGEGLCIATTQLLEQNDGDEAWVRQALDANVGCIDSIFVPPLQGETIPHVDLFLQFAEADLALIGHYHPEQDPINAPQLDALAQSLKGHVTPSGAPLRVARIPMPTPHAYGDTREPYRMSYLNLVPLNERVLVPIYLAERSREDAALRALSKAFPDREIRPIASDVLAPGDGALHCITQTLPQAL